MGNADSIPTDRPLPRVASGAKKPDASFNAMPAGKYFYECDIPYTSWTRTKKDHKKIHANFIHDQTNKRFVADEQLRLKLERASFEARLQEIKEGEEQEKATDSEQERKEAAEKAEVEAARKIVENNPKIPPNALVKAMADLEHTITLPKAYKLLTTLRTQRRRLTSTRVLERLLDETI